MYTQFSHSMMSATEKEVFELNAPKSKTVAHWVESLENNSQTRVQFVVAKEDKTQYYMKRAFDTLVALGLLPLVFPVMVMVAIAIRLESKGNVVFKQTRIGRYGKPFTCYKFRSMFTNAEEIKAQLMSKNESDGPVFKMKQDPRVTKVGRIIRKLSLDELPQLFNILFGDMSLVGPRPAVTKEVLQYTQHQLGRLNAIPGLTGLQQVSGRSNLDFARWIELDLQYIEEQSIARDVQILLMTVPAVVTGHGAY